jgi:sugar/nucleoside kinase (ribokinase family)
MRVVCVGLATRDTIAAVPERPPLDGRILASSLVVAGGGPAATAAVTLARLGVDVLFAGAVGDDDAGRFVREGLEREGVDVSKLTVMRGARTPESVILVGPDGSRSIVHRPGDAPCPEVDTDADWLHVDHVGYGRVHGKGRRSVDGGNAIPGLDLRGVTLYAPTEARLRADFGDAAAALAAGAEIVVTTRGAHGSSAATRDGVVDAPAAPCEPVSTLGAGDVFHGALLAWLGRGAELPAALAAANTAAALSCRALDGRSAIPTLEELERSLA